MPDNKLYIAYRNMIRRCYNPADSSYLNYGGRGIAVCPEWRNDRDAFYDWAEANGCTDGLTLDRIDNNGDYSPQNCRWVSVQVQSRNQRRNKRVTFNGETLILTEWAERLGVRADTLARRLGRYGMPVEKAFTQGSLSTGWSHGTRYGYENGCRCDACRAKHAERHRAMRAARKEKTNAN